MTSANDDSVVVLLREGLLASAVAEADLGYWSLHLGVSEERIIGAMTVLVDRGVLRSEQRWECSSCGTENVYTRRACVDCDSDRPVDAVFRTAFFAPSKTDQRDPAALFLIHGMNTHGAWQQALSWKVQLQYGYSVPIRIYKYGWDVVSPLTRGRQSSLVGRLVADLRLAQRQLEEAGKSVRCDIVAHSFGTLLIGKLLLDERNSDILLGRVVLTGSIVPRDFGWRDILARGQVEAVLNHSAGRDIWVKYAPWFFPDVGTSGRDGFLAGSGVREWHEPEFRHSDFFKGVQLDTSVSAVWKPFLDGNHGLEQERAPKTDVSGDWMKGRYWVGRAAILTMLLVAVLFGLA